MIITTKLNKCKGCEDLLSIVDEIDCYLADKGKILLDNLRYSLDKKVNLDDIKDATRYKQILIARSQNAAYAYLYDIRDIIDHAKQIIYR